MSRWRHKKRGTTYTLRGTGLVSNSGEPLVDGDEVEIYQSEDDWKWYVRRKTEFHDGRFEELKGRTV